MMSKFNHTTLAIAVASIGAIGSAHAAGLDRSGQDVSAFLQDGTYAEMVYTYIDADISGKDNSGHATGDIAKVYDFFRYGVKTDINDIFSVGVLYDEPFGAAVSYKGNSDFITQGGDQTISKLTANASTPLPTLKDAQDAYDLLSKKAILLKGGVEAGDKRIKQLREQGKLDALPPGALEAHKESKKQAIELLGPNLDGQSGTIARLAGAIRTAKNAEAKKGEGTNVEIRTQNATLLLGAKLGESKNFQIYGGPAIQRVDGKVHLRGITYGGMGGYDARISPNVSYGWVAGAFYSKPEIALKAALTYRSEIDHERSVAEVIPATGYAGSQNFKVTLPESWNLDFQTGVNPTTLLTAKVRYVPWSEFDIRPPAYGATTARVNNGTPLPIVNYAKDQWQAEIGIGKKLSDKLSVLGNVGYDSGAGNPVSTLGPIKGYYSVGVGAKYNITPQWSISLGGKYLKFGDATAQLPTKQAVGKFEDNDGFAVGAKLAYHAK